MNRAADLARARAAVSLSEDSCLVWLGVGLATLERIESGEVEPSDDTAERIDRFLQLYGGGFFPTSALRPPVTHSGGPPGGGSLSDFQTGGLAAGSGERSAVGVFDGAPIQANRGAL